MVLQKIWGMREEGEREREREREREKERNIIRNKTLPSTFQLTEISLNATIKHF
jgi:hypothetical protein